MGMSGAMFQMIAHGISSAGMFFLVGVVYDRVHHRDLNRFGGLFGKMPVYSGVSFAIFFAAMGLPGLCGFIGEILVVLASWRYSAALAVIAAAVVILTAGYILWTLQRVYLGPEYKGPHGEALTRITPRELGIAVPLVALAIILGVVPGLLLGYVNPSVRKTVTELAGWTRQVKEAPPATQVTQNPQPARPPGQSSASVRPSPEAPAGIPATVSPSGASDPGLPGVPPTPAIGRKDRLDVLSPSPPPKPPEERGDPGRPPSASPDLQPAERRQP